MNKNTKLILIIVGAIIITVLFILGYLFVFDKDESNTNNQNNNQENNSESIIEHDYVFKNDNITASIDFEGKVGALEIENNEEEVIEELSVYTYKDEEKVYLDMVEGTDTGIPSRAHYEATIPEDTELTDSSYIGLEIAGEERGGFYAASSLSTLPDALNPAMTNFPDNPSTIRPTSGTWNFELTGNTDDLSGSNCPSGFAGFGSSGEATLDVDSTGLFSTLNIDSQSIFFHRPSANATDYQSGEFTFPILIDEDTYIDGRVSFTYNAVDQEIIEGEIHMDTMQGCTADYPFQMELIIPSENPPFVPHQGNWTLTFTGAMVCGDAPINTGFTPALLSNAGIMNVTGGGPSPMWLNFSAGVGSFGLTQSYGTNFYNSFSNIFLGTAIEADGPTNYMGTYQATAISDSMIIGVIYVTCIGEHNGTQAIPFIMNNI
ncbi:MAG: hypothetical protein ABID45_03125 [Patescibacteria group bacterium]